MAMANPITFEEAQRNEQRFATATPNLQGIGFEQAHKNNQAAKERNRKSPLDTALSSRRLKREHEAKHQPILTGIHDAIDYAAPRLPFVGGGFTIDKSLKLKGSVERIEANEADFDDWQRLAEYIDEAEAQQNRGALRQAFDLATHIPGFAAEFATTGGAFTGGKKAAERAAIAAVKSALSRQAVKAASKHAAGRVALGTATKVPAVAAGAAAQAAANPQLVGQQAVERMVPEFQLSRDDQQRLQLEIAEPGESFAEALPKGYVEAVIEMGAERSGGMIGKIPALQQLKAATIGRWLKRNPSGKASDLFDKVAREGGWNGVIGEVFEERIGEVARGATPGLDRDFGVTGQLASGNFGPGAEQLAVESMAFSVFPAGRAAIEQTAGPMLDAQDRKERLAMLQESRQLHDQDRQEILRPEVATAYAEQFPEEAKTLAQLESPTRNQWRDAGIRLTLRGDDRAAFAKMVREALAVGAPQAAKSTTSPDVTAEETADQSAEDTTPATTEVATTRQPEDIDETLDEAEGREQAADAGPVGAVVDQDRAPFEYVPTDQLQIRPEELQFKSGVNDSGVVEGEQLDGEWDETAAGVVLVWEDADRKRYIVNGHHRYDLAKRNNVPSMLAQVVRESDGVTLQQAKVLGIELNIKEGQGSVNDYAKFFHETDLSEEEAERRGLLARAKGRTGYLVGKFASDDLWAAYAADKITAEKAAAITDIARDDAGLQAVGLARAKKASAAEIRHSLRALKMFPGERQQTQGDLFGFDDSAIREAEAMGEAAADIIRQRKERVLAVRGAVKRPEAAAEMGLSGNMAEVEQELQRLREELAEWERWETDPKLVAEVRDRAGLSTEGMTDLRDGGGEASFIGNVGMLVAEPGDGVPKDEIANQQVIRFMSEAFDVPIRIGQMGSSKAAGIFKVLPEVVRLKGKHAGDLAVASHEVAHAVDKREQPLRALAGEGMGELRRELNDLDYDQSKRRAFEGFAEFVRFWLTEDNAQQKAPKFYDWWVNSWLPVHPELREKFAETKALIQKWQSQGAEARVRANMSRTGKGSDHSVMDDARRAVFKLRSMVDDEYAALEDFVKQVEQKTGRKLTASQNPYVLARVLGKSASALAADAVANGPVSLVDRRRLADGIRGALAKINPDDLDAFTLFLWARHARDVWKSGRNPGGLRTDANHLFEKYQHFPGFQEAAEEITAWNNAMVEMLAEVGGISQEAKAAIVNAYPAYVPLKRVVDTMKQSGMGRGLVNVGNPAKRMSAEGSGREFVDPLASMVMSATQYYSAATKIVVGRAIADIATEHEGLGFLVEELPGPTETMKANLGQLERQLEAAGADLSEADLDAVISITQASGFYKGGEPIVSIHIDGKRRWFQLNKELYDAVTRMDVYQLPKLLDATAGLATRATRMGATAMRASFGLGFNPIRDMMTSMIQTEADGVVAGPSKVFLRTLANWLYRVPASKMAAAKGKQADPYWEIWKQFGGELSGYIGQDVRQAYTTVREVMNDAHQRQLHNIVMHPLEFLQSILGIPEAGPRLAEMETVLEQHGVTRESIAAGETIPMDALYEAMLAANEVTTDFKRGGSIMQVLNRVEAFSNARVQGYTQPARKIARNPVRFMLRGFTFLTLPTIAYWMMVRDEEWYQELPPWLRFSFWNFKASDGTVIRVPRPFEHGTVFSAMPEAMLDSLYREDPKRAQQLAEEMSPGFNDAADLVMFDAIQPPLELLFNYQVWQGREVVSEQLQHREPKDQFYSWNTSASKYLGEAFNVSPARLDHLMHNYSGGMATDVARIPEEGPARALGFGRFVRQVERGESVDEFYDEVRDVDQKYHSAKVAGAVPDSISNRRWRMNQIATLMGEIRDEARKHDDPAKQIEYQRFITGLSRFALDKPELDMYPNPLALPEDLPPEIKHHVDELHTKYAKAMARQEPRRNGRRVSEDKLAEEHADWQRDVTRSVKLFEDAQVDDRTIVRAHERYLKTIKTQDIRSSARKRLRGRLAGNGQQPLPRP